MAPKPSRMTTRISSARVRMRRKAAVTEISIACENRCRSTASWVKLCTVGKALSVSSA
jgi:hypothetical protein